MQPTDILVIGAGPAGIAAAVCAAESGRSVLIVDDSSGPGGQIWRGGALTRSAREWTGRLSASGAQFVGDTTIIDAIDAFTFLAEREGRAVTLRADMAVIIATGAREMFLPFPGWTLPGVVGAGGAQALLKRGWNVRGRRVIVAGSGPLLLAVAASLHAAGARLAAVVEQTTTANVRRFGRGLWRTPRRLLTGAQYRWTWRRTPWFTGTWVTRAEGDGRVQRISLGGERSETLECDVLCSGFGLVASTEVPRLVGCTTTQRGVTVDEMQQTSVPSVYSAGETVAVGGVDAALIQGRIAGFAAAGNAKAARALFGARARQARFAAQLRIAFALRPEIMALADAQTIVCRCEDVALGRLQAFESLREARVHARVGMGACQGRVCGAALRHLRGWADNPVRPPVAPASVSSLIHVGRSDGSHAEE